MNIHCFINLDCDLVMSCVDNVILYLDKQLMVYSACKRQEIID